MGFAKTDRGRVAKRRYKKRLTLRRRAEEACARSAVGLGNIRYRWCVYLVRPDGIRGWNDKPGLTAWTALTDADIEALLNVEFESVPPLRSPLEVLALI